VLGDVLRAGYDRTFEELDGAGGGGAGGGRSRLGRGWAGVVVDAAGSSVALPAGVGLDPGGIGKGCAADLVAEELRAAGAAGVSVNLGGDLRVEGRAPGGGSWVVGIEQPLRPGPAATVTLARGAVATSSRVRRAWGRAGDRRHHLIDPATVLWFTARASEIVAWGLAAASVAWGIAGMYLLLAVEQTSLARLRAPRRLWRRVHYAGFAVYLLTTVHGLTAGTDGTDGRAPAFLVANAIVAALVAGLTASRVAAAGDQPRARAGRTGGSARQPALRG
jgi:ApbE family